MEYTIRTEDEGRRVREILRSVLSVSYTAMKSAKWGGRILLNGDPVFVDARVHAGDVLRIDWEEDRPVYRLKPYPIELRIPYLDEHLMIVDKPAGLASQSSAGHPDDSLENAVFARFGCPENFVYRPVNRLDKGTGGLMAVARNPHAQHLLQKQLHSPLFRRGYLALTDGIPEKESGVIDLPIGKVDAASVRREVRADGSPSVTRYRVLRKEGNRALMYLELGTGRTHQIRVHLSHLGCPVRGDFLYGRELPEEFPGCFALHSALLELKHPLTGETLFLTSVPAWAGNSEEITACLHPGEDSETGSEVSFFPKGEEEP